MPQSLRRPALPPAVRALALVLVAALAVLLVPSAALATSSAGPATAPTTRLAVAPAAPTDRVVLVGTGGVTWEDVSADATPHLWSLAVDGAAGNLVVRSVGPTTCPADGWLALSTGTRAADAAPGCRTLDDAAPGVGSSVPGWAELTDAVATQSYSAEPGALGDAVSAAGLTATAVGPGAALALATSAGTVAGTVVPTGTTSSSLTATGSGSGSGSGSDGTVPVSPMPSLRADITAALATSRLVVVDAGAVRAPAGSDGGAPADVATVDAHVGAVLDAVRADDPTLARTTVLVASLADSGTTARLGVVAVVGNGAAPAGGAAPTASPTAVGTLTSQSTHQPGLVQTSDVVATVADLLGLTDELPRSALSGSLLTSDGSGAPAAERVDALADVDLHARSVMALVQPFFLLLSVVGLLLVAAAVAATTARGQRALRSRALRRGAGSPVRVLQATRAAGVAVAALPVATLLANASPWWRTGAPGLVLVVLVLAWCATLTVLAVAGPWRRTALGPVTVVMALTAVVLAVDVATGVRLQTSALVGIHPTVAGRFYGFSNIAFALFAVAMLLVAAAVADRLVARGRRGLAAASVAALGLVAVVLDGAPGIGADLGGPPGLVPAFGVLALVAGGVRLTWRRVVAVLGAAAAVVVAFAVVDRLRPEASRTHLGAFVDTVLDGGLWDVVSRKLGANLATFREPLALVGAVVVVAAAVLAYRSLRAASTATGDDAWLTSGVPLGRVRADVPMLVPAALCSLAALGIGMLVNDSGVVIMATGLAVLVPAVVAATAGWGLSLAQQVPTGGR